MVWQVNENATPVVAENHQQHSSGNRNTLVVSPTSSSRSRTSSTTIDIAQPSPGSGLQTEAESESPTTRSSREDLTMTIENPHVIEMARDAIEELSPPDPTIGDHSSTEPEVPMEPKEDFTQHLT